jgi:hypothetical protein
VALLFTILIAGENGKHGVHFAFIFTLVINKVVGIVSLNFDSNFNHTCNPTFFQFNFYYSSNLKAAGKNMMGLLVG